LAAVATAGAALFKGLGLAVLLGSWLLLLSRRWRRREVVIKLLVYTGFSVLPVLLWQLRCWATPSVGFLGRNMLEFYYLQDPYAPGSPLVSFSDLLVRIRHNIVWGLSANLASVVLSPLYFIRYKHDLLACLVGLPLVCWLAWQWLQACRAKPSVLEGCVFVGLAALLLYFHGNTERYVAFLYPALVVYAVRGLRALVTNEAWRRRVLLGWLSLSMISTLVAAVDQWRDPFGSPTIRDYVLLARQAKATLPPMSRCVAPMSVHWQVLTGHRCLTKAAAERDGAASADYAVVLAETSAWSPEDHAHLNNFEGDLIRGAVRLTAALQPQAGALPTVARTARFRLVRLRRG